MNCGNDFCKNPKAYPAATAARVIDGFVTNVCAHCAAKMDRLGQVETPSTRDERTDR